MRTNVFPNHRSGLSLIEVLAATMILLIGVLGTISAVTLGVFQTSRVKIADTSAACGRAALRQIRMADWQKPETLGLGSSHANPYIVDPLGFYNSASDSYDSSRTAFPAGAGILSRYTFNYSTSTPQEYKSVVFRDFLWQDDITYSLASASERPVMLNRDAGFGEPGYVASPSPANPQGTVQASAEQFSWMFMVTPFVDSTSNPLPLGEVSAIVFYQRDDAMDGERSCDGWFESNIYPQDNSPNGELTIRAGSKKALDLSTIRYVLAVDTNATPTTAKWYRVISDGKIVDSSDSNYTFERTLFITGPTWHGRQGTGNNNMFKIILCDGVVGVYTETMPR